MRLTVRAVVGEAELGRFSLRANQIAPFNAFLSLSNLQARVKLPGRANLMLASGDIDPISGDIFLELTWQLADAELEVRSVAGGGEIELRSPRVFLDPAKINAAEKTAQGPRKVLTYFANEIRRGFFLLGAWTRRGSDLPLIIFFGLYYIAMLFWPELQGIRFIFPLLPIFVYFVLQGIRFAIQKLPGRTQILCAGLIYGFWLVTLAIFLFASGTRAYGNVIGERRINGPVDPVSSDMYNYIRAETSPDSVIVFWKPRAMRLFTNRNTFMSTECDRLGLGDYVVIRLKAENSQIPPDEIDKCNLAQERV